MTKYVSGGPDIDLEKEEIYDSHGNRITNEYVKRAVEEVHVALGAGRPSLSGSEGPSPRVQFRIPQQLQRTAFQRAEAEHKTLSELARDALEKYLLAS